MKVKTNLKANTPSNDNPYHHLFLSWFKAAYSSTLSKNNACVFSPDSHPPEVTSEQNTGGDGNHRDSNPRLNL